MDILQEDNSIKGRFYILENDICQAEMTYIWAGTDRIIIDHTEVHDGLNGKNAGKQLVMQAVSFAREQGIKIIPLCPFAHSVFKRIPEIQDVL